MDDLLAVGGDDAIRSVLDLSIGKTKIDSREDSQAGSLLGL
jgi:hypothetical protein